MPELTLAAGDRETRVLIEPESMSHIRDSLTIMSLARDYGSLSLITDDNVARLYAAAATSSFSPNECALRQLSVPAGERSKSLACLATIYEWLAAGKVGRDGLILALGGGVVSDLAGFAAATWMRGIRHVICVTTVEGAVDAAIGGKTAINLPSAKNLVGAFHPPVLVVVDPESFATLPARDVSAGLAESVKHALITDEALLEWHEAHTEALLARDVAVLTELVVRNVRIKGDVVARDPFEVSGARMALNFGHTVGHAIEACGEYALRHGECVGLGMIAACRLSALLGLTGERLVDRVRTLLKRLNLPTRLPGRLDHDALLEAMRRDKKAQSGRLRFVLLGGIGRVVVRDDVTDTQILDALSLLAD